MAYLVQADLKTHIYSELITEIQRSDTDITATAINEAIAMAKGYLSRFNITKLFDDGNVSFVDDKQLLSVVKDITVYKLIKLSNPNLMVDEMRIRFEEAIAWLKDVQRGVVDPPGWPYKDDDADTDTDEAAAIQYLSNDKRSNHY